ncbi:DUF7344 domain-containing protein [Halosimplex halobium]|uniref:DUF7344 domain-containing protein n=1 Tax=Halosimplex halobium TaxID=3396618 RepID=UPI003F56737D
MNRQSGAPVRGGGDRELATVLGDLRQRRVLSILYDRSGPIGVRDLGVKLAARERDVEPSAVPESARTSVVADLEHRCLPKLDATGLIERDQESVVALSPLPIETDLSLPPLSDPEHRDWDPISVLVARPLRQGVVATLADHEHRITMEALATALQSRCNQTIVPDDDQQLRTQLHHIGLPKLAAVDLVMYDTTAQTVTRTRRTVAIVRRMDLKTTDDRTPS